jgi:hypothetical protein
MRARWLCSRLEARLLPPKRDPDFIIGGTENPYLCRWFLIPKNRWFNIYLHHIRRSDDDRALHCHPWASVSLCLAGTMGEVLRPGWRNVEAGDVIFRRASHAHRLVVDDGPCWTLFITGPIVRQWGFYCPKGWRHWREFVSLNDPGLPGPGCD